jgi:hypothetical protein
VWSRWYCNLTHLTTETTAGKRFVTVQRGFAGGKALLTTRPNGPDGGFVDKMYDTVEQAVRAGRRALGVTGPVVPPLEKGDPSPVFPNNRPVRTTQERRANQDEPLARKARKGKNLPNAWDDLVNRTGLKIWKLAIRWLKDAANKGRKKDDVFSDFRKKPEFKTFTKEEFTLLWKWRIDGF